MIDTNQLPSELKSAIGQAYLFASVGDSQDRVNYTTLLLTLLGTAVQMTDDKRGMERIKDAREMFLPAIHDLKHEFTSPDAMVKCMNTLIFVGPMIFQQKYGKIENIKSIKLENINQIPGQYKPQKTESDS